MTDPVLREAGTTDRAAIEAIARAAYAIYLPRLGRAPAPMLQDFEAPIAACHVRIALIDEGLAGYALRFPKAGAMFIENIAVHPKWQGHGIGRCLLADAEHAARAAGLQRIALYTNEVMTESQRFYRRLGFLETDRRCEDGFDRVYLAKSLDPSETALAPPREDRGGERGG